MRDMTATDARHLLETGNPPRQLLANVAIAAGIGVGKEYMFEVSKIIIINVSREKARSHKSIAVSHL